MIINSNSGGGLGVQEPEGEAHARVKCPATAGSTSHRVIQFLIDLLCVAWWAGFVGVTALGVAWAVFVCLCVRL